MNEIIFWFSNGMKKGYWFNYAIRYCKNNTIFNARFNKMESWIKISDLKISFRINYRGDNDLAGNWHKNQYWVEDLFDNNFEVFFRELIKQNINKGEY